MKADLSLPQLTAAMSRFLHRYHVVIFVLTVVGGLALANFMLNQAINEKPIEQPQAISNSFDKETMDKINQLNESSTQSTNFVLPSGRINPFI